MAFLNRGVFKESDPKNTNEVYQKVKVDRQIIAIFKVAGVEDIYTDDAGMTNRARLCGMNPIATSDLPIPEKDRQLNIEFEAADDIPEPTDESPL